jgi:hypothetical protein
MAKRNDSADRRILTITNHPGYHPKKIPFIRISGKWLIEAGFLPHTKVLLRVMKGCIVVTSIEET